ncbi:MAG: type II toxin-antitoxin system CcdA family antitoxin [Candidatus Methanoperedens sp.]|nr:type II toxin-antitoxin system CcdA family antitoxin [Candidatus Methanoperedens sp.]
MKAKITLSVESELIKMAKDSDMNISEFLENQLAAHFKIKKEVRWITI